MAADNSFTDAAIAQKSVVANSSAQNKNHNNSNSNSGGVGLSNSSNECGKELEAFAFDDEHDSEQNNKINNKLYVEGIEESNLNELPTHLSHQLNINGVDPDTVNGDMTTGSGWCAEEILMTNRTKYGYKST